MATSPGSAASVRAVSGTVGEQLDRTRVVYASDQYQAVQELYWRSSHGKRSAPTPQHSNLTTPAEPEQDMEVDGSTTTPEQPGLLQPFNLEPDAALEVTVAALGINPQDKAAVNAWLEQPVASNRELFATMRAYREQVIRPECFSLTVQLETGLKTLNNNLFNVRRELSWMSADNRLAQKHACGVQLLATGWPQGLSPPDREYMLGWMLQNTPKIVTFCKDRGVVNDHNAHEVKRYLQVLATDPVTVPAGGDFWSGMTLLTFRAYDLRSSFLEIYGGGMGSPVYTDESTPVKGRHIKVAPCSPQWQRKLEMSCVNSHPDHNAQSRLTILWKTLTLMEPVDGDEFKAFFTLRRMGNLKEGWRQPGTWSVCLWHPPQRPQRQRRTCGHKCGTVYSATLNTSWIRQRPQQFQRPAAKLPLRGRA